MPGKYMGIMASQVTRFRRIFGPKQLPFKLAGLQFRMTISYTLVTLVAVLLIELLVGTVIYLSLHFGGLADDEFMTAARGTAELYAFEAAIQAEDGTLNPRTTFEPDKPFSIALSDKASANHPMQVSFLPENPSDPQSVTFALLILPEGRVLASSYPARYAPMSIAAQLLPDNAQAITDALGGVGASSAALTADGRIVWAVEPVWSRARQTIGAI